MKSPNDAFLRTYSRQ